jgi:N4-gp56 family major capsid protein
LKVENIQEVNFNGFQGYIAIIHPYQTAQLRTNTSWFDAHMNAGPRDEHNNLIFKGHMANNAVGLWNNIMLFESNKVHAGDQSEWTDLISGDSGSNTVEIDSSAGDVRRALFFGQNAVSLAVGKDPSIITKKDFDYFEHQGEAVNAIFGMERFEPLIDTSATDIVSQGMMVLSTFSPATQA